MSGVRQDESLIRVHAVCTYPKEAAATRFRIVQYVAPLRERGIEITVSPFLDAHFFAMLYDRSRRVETGFGILSRLVRRLGDFEPASRASVLFVQREAALVGPPLFELVVTKLLRKPIILDLDDPTYISLDSPVHGRMARILKWPSKTEHLLRLASHVICGSEAVEQHAALAGVPTTLLRTTVDLEVYKPALRANRVPVIGWIGTHTTFPYVETILPALAELAATDEFVLRVIGSGRQAVNVPGVEVELVDWALATEVPHLQHFDIGIYPLIDDEWAAGKSGLKAIQYLAVGVPFVTTPVGAARKIGEEGKTHFFARSSEEWRAALQRLLRDPELRAQMGQNGRMHAVAHYGMREQCDRLENAIRSVVNAAATRPSRR